MVQNHHVIEFNSSRSTYTVIAHCDTKDQANAVIKRVKAHFNYTGNPIEDLSSYEFGYLEAIS